MDKTPLHQLILQRLAADLDVAVRAAQTAHETATHEENVAENKYDTLGLEAAYLAAGQSRRVEEIRQALARLQQLILRDHDDALGIQTSALLALAPIDGGETLWAFLAPDAAGLKVNYQGREILLITPRSPLGGSLLGRQIGDEVETGQGRARQTYEILEAH
ncbi:MAG: hypothetical protein GAK43_00899 [Stenotrophomonas maltophilia]|nr:MAG: hypothetical protein GAK43_00899 [Stenotrophomonas maltophilia]